MHSYELTASLLAVATFISSTTASPILETRSITTKRGISSPSLAVYWGNGYNQQRLADFCQDTTMDIIPIGFVNVFPDQENGPGTNYANACGGDYWVAPDGTQTQMFKTCYQIAEDIPKCQQMGKKIFASIGGASPGNFIASTDSAKAFADFLWGSFGPLQDPDLIQFPRPFGTDVIVDGFDLDIESGSNFGYADLVNELRAKFVGQPKTYYISSAPQCVVPDSHLGDAIANAPFDYVFVQYYNTNQCSARSLFNSGTLNTNTDITYGWASWLQQNSKNPGVKMFLGLPASPDAAHSSDYLNLDEAKSLIEAYACGNDYQSIFGGVMLWEATFSENNQINDKSYAANIKDLFGQLPCAPVLTTTTSATTSTTTTSALTTTTTTGAPVTTTTSTTPLSPTSTTTTTYQHPHETSTTTSGSSVITTSSTASESLVATTSSTTFETTTTSSYSLEVGPIGSTTSSSVSSSTTTSYGHPVGPTGSATSSRSLSTTTSSYSHEGGPIGSTTSSSSSSSSTSMVETTTSAYTGSYSYPVGPTGDTTASSSTTSSVTLSTSRYDWADWTTSSTTSSPFPVVDPTFSSATTTTTLSWEDWPATTTSTTSASVSDYTTTVWVTSYIDICPTGFTTRPFTLTTTVPVAPASTTAPFVWPTEPNGCPRGFTTAVTVCSVCAETVSTVTLTIPVPTVTAVETQTVVPVKPSAPIVASAQPSDYSHPVPTFTLATVTKPAETSIAPVEGSSASGLVHPAGSSNILTISLTSVAPASTGLGNSGWLAPPALSSSSVSPVSITPFTGGAAQDELPGAVLSVAVCMVVAVVGLFV
ncbi:uncharacterized protein Z518_00331 [Rhinocladiella mackenziei CBS 650.93]|uniref:chitinase n=1 Tax=Rhinocladiella mackenziei CBS 650.93 TaxID=1442369 RepID=A0A0D2G3R1_9EURO|nr:uncharacterized protein Z518_00331 [Rhinocladiella mackenziei CBS 650.93]KIX09252.1 hypothetical protein Z518_00331 [Rhinocladiella mackenziei CBS 650.93]